MDIYIIFLEVCIYLCFYHVYFFIAAQTTGPIAIKLTEL